MSKYICKECGSDQVQMQAWVDINTLEYKDIVDTDDYWCDNCKDFVEIKEEDEKQNIS